VTEKLGEFEIIETYFSPLTKDEKGAFNLADDAAVLEVPKGKSLVITTDTLVEGIHFLTGDLPKNIGAKLLRVSLSDLAAMGSVPAYYNLSIAFKASSITSNWFKEFADALLKDQNQFGITLIGGDTVSTTGPLTLTITAFGVVQKGKVLRRNGARVGDDIWVSGSIGDAALGLKVASGELENISRINKNHLLSRYFKPIPQTFLGPKLVDHINSAIDISDGLIADLNHICKASNLGAQIQLSSIPLSKATKTALATRPDYIDLILGGGDDFELLFTADKSFRILQKSLTKELKVSLTRIGNIVEGSSTRIIDEKGKEYPLSKAGYTHF